MVKTLLAKAGDAGDAGLIPGSGRSPGGGAATHYSILARKIPWTEEPGRLQFMGTQSQTWLSTHTQTHTTEYLESFIIIHIALSIHSEKAVASHSSTLAWKIPWMEEPGRLQSMGSLRVGHD